MAQNHEWFHPNQQELQKQKVKVFNGSFKNLPDEWLNFYCRVFFWDGNPSGHDQVGKVWTFLSGVYSAPSWWPQIIYHPGTPNNQFKMDGTGDFQPFPTILDVKICFIVPLKQPLIMVTWLTQPMANLYTFRDSIFNRKDKVSTFFHGPLPE